MTHIGLGIFEKYFQSEKIRSNIGILSSVLHQLGQRIKVNFGPSHVKDSTVMMEMFKAMEKQILAIMDARSKLQICFEEKNKQKNNTKLINFAYKKDYEEQMFQLFVEIAERMKIIEELDFKISEKAKEENNKKLVQDSYKKYLNDVILVILPIKQEHERLLNELNNMLSSILSLSEELNEKINNSKEQAAELIETLIDNGYPNETIDEVNRYVELLDTYGSNIDMLISGYKNKIRELEKTNEDGNNGAKIIELGNEMNSLIEQINTCDHSISAVKQVMSNAKDMINSGTADKQEVSDTLTQVIQAQRLNIQKLEERVATLNLANNKNTNNKPSF